MAVVESFQEPAATPGAADIAADELVETIGRNLKRLRTRQGHSLERLARISGVSRAMLGQIEHGKSAPTIGLLSKIARALDVPLTTLITASGANGATVLRKAQSRLLISGGGAFTSRALLPFAVSRRIEFYELRLEPGCIEKTEGHPPGTTECLTVADGAVEIVTGQTVHPLCEGDSITFEADTPHTYRNKGSLPARLFLVISISELTQ